MSDAASFPLARYRFDFQATTPIRLPDYAGSMLRGAFGHALRQLACMTRQKECAGCPLMTTCPYPKIFAPLPPAAHPHQKFSAIPVPYIIEPPESGAHEIPTGAPFSFQMVLVGRALAELPLIILAWRRALSRGVGALRGTAELISVTHCGVDGMGETVVHRPDLGALVSHRQNVPISTNGSIKSDTTRVTLQFVTPLRLQQNGHALSPEKIDTRALLMALVRRTTLLAEFHGVGGFAENFPSLLAACGEIRGEKKLHWRDWTRYSSRQQQKMTLGGVVGEWILEGTLDPFSKYLHLGQWLHVGKEAAFGLGHYRLIANS